MNKQIVFFVEGFHQDPRERAQHEGLEIPADWTVWNAARPLYGHEQWTGEFRHGLFYAAIDPCGESHQYFTVRNHELDGWICQWVTQEEVFQTVRSYYETRFPDQTVNWDNFEYTDFVNSFFHIKDKETQDAHRNG